ncbi:LD-carboxypeptidase [Ottowia caeni]|uniref:LD-carboxypeptidase n=1 Tax=Ottowia caeni TaxID=2870339 RepID=UPI001E31E60D|nr:LD-carboxypeptidase [Ottowia caeni]
MAHIYVYSPSGAVRDRASFKRGIKRLQALGHEVEIDPTALDTWQRFAGDDATRLASVARAAASGADVALTTRGGYGLSRLLPDLPYRQIAKSIEKGTHFVGFSDFTALQLALYAKTEAITWSGPALCEGFGTNDPEGPDEITMACFDDLLSGSGEGAGWRVKPSSEQDHSSGLLAKQATLWGGNLAMLVSLLGTPYFPEIKNGVLFLEDVGEHPYRIERMMTQLMHAGVLRQQKAIVLGQFTEYKLTPQDKGYTLAKMVEWLRTQVKCPILTGLPFGHVPTKVLLPVGKKVDFLLEDRDAFLLWGHVH